MSTSQATDHGLTDCRSTAAFVLASDSVVQWDSARTFHASEWPVYGSLATDASTRWRWTLSVTRVVPVSGSYEFGDTAVVVEPWVRRSTTACWSAHWKYDRKSQVAPPHTVPPAHWRRCSSRRGTAPTDATRHETCPHLDVAKGDTYSNKV